MNGGTDTAGESVAPHRAPSPAILIVDDHAANLLAFEAILKPLGHPIAKATSGAEALRCLLQHDVALVLLDVQMPEMSGIDLAAMLRSHKRLSNVPIIFVTAINRDPSHVFQGYAQGAVDYVLKPVEPELLRVRVKVFLELGRRQEQIREQAARLHAHEMRDLERQNRQRFQDLTECIPFPIWGLDPDGRVDVCNQAWTDYAEALAAETGVLVGPRWVHPEDLERAHEAWSEGTRSGAPFEIECRLHCARDGTFRWHILRAVAEHGDRALDGHWIVVGVDIDAKKTAEHERARILAREQRAREQAEEANRVKDEFLATVSHELRTPLNAILGWARILRTERLDEKLSRALDTIERNALAQARLVNDILDVSRIATGRLHLQVDTFDLSEAVNEAVDALRPAADGKNLELKWERPRLPVLVVGDGARLQQVAWNLVSNAVKFTPERGTVRVEVAVDHENGHVRIVVADTGPGIAPAFLPHAFDRFRQGDATATRAHEGLGLGLAIVKHLVELHGGRVTAESGPGQGQGARLTVTLPIGERGPSGASCRDPGAVTPRDPPFPFDDPHL